MEGPDNVSEKFDNILFNTQSQDYLEDILNKVLLKAHKFDKALPKIEEFLTSIGHNIQMLEECHCLIIRLINTQNFQNKTKEVALNIFDSFLSLIGDKEMASSPNLHLKNTAARSRNSSRLEDRKGSYFRTRRFGDDISNLNLTYHRKEDHQFKTYIKIGKQISTPVKTPRFSNGLDDLPKQDFLEIISIICVSLAIKKEETVKFTYFELQHLIGTNYRNSQLLEAEQLVCETLEWNLNLPTCYELTQRLLTFVNHEYDFSSFLSKTQEFVDLCFMEPKLLKFGVVDMAFGSIIYSLEFYQWSDFLEQWKEAIFDSFGHIFIKCKNQTYEQKKERMFRKSMCLKDEVMDIINTFKSVKDDITSLKQSISHLSSLAQESNKVSIVRGVSILNNEESKLTSDEEFISFSVSQEVSEHERQIKQNIYKLKRDISNKIMNNQHLKKLVNNFPRNRFEQSEKKEKISVVQGDILNLDKFTKSLEIDDLEDKQILDHLESNINSFLPSHENTSILTEGKSSIHFPQPQRYNHKNFVSRNINLQPDAIKRRLNSDIQKCQFYENLYCHMKQNSTVNRPSSDLNDIELTVVETARFGKSQDYGTKRIEKDFSKAIRNIRQRPSNYKPHSKCSSKRKSVLKKSKVRESIPKMAHINPAIKFQPPSKHKLIKLQPKMFPVNDDRLHTTRVSHASQDWKPKFNLKPRISKNAHKKSFCGSFRQAQIQESDRVKRIRKRRLQSYLS
ncbi:unnamed protein product [Moneuplotes crassus]|uniref:Cyclin N-terminal domain-containing protein n=1 Tax=Euplotes crassus TaxID=5936 RepID=A0AAD1Y8K5_EUPCR|nr:unnamed protein product [Moneuplotes crassus]